MDGPAGDPRLACPDQRRPPYGPGPGHAPRSRCVHGPVPERDRGARRHQDRAQAGGRPPAARRDAGEAPEVGVGGAGGEGMTRLIIAALLALTVPAAAEPLPYVKG